MQLWIKARGPFYIEGPADVGGGHWTALDSLGRRGAAVPHTVHLGHLTASAEAWLLSSPDSSSPQLSRLAPMLNAEAPLQRSKDKEEPLTRRGCQGLRCSTFATPYLPRTDDARRSERWMSRQRKMLALLAEELVTAISSRSRWSSALPLQISACIPSAGCGLEAATSTGKRRSSWPLWRDTWACMAGMPTSVPRPPLSSRPQKRLRQEVRERRGDAMRSCSLLKIQGASATTSIIITLCQGSAYAQFHERQAQSEQQWRPAELLLGPMT